MFKNVIFSQSAKVAQLVEQSANDPQAAGLNLVATDNQIKNTKRFYILGKKVVQLVEQSINYPKFQGLNLSSKGTNRNFFNVRFLQSAQLVEQPINDSQAEGLNPVASGTQIKKYKKISLSC